MFNVFDIIVLCKQKSVFFLHILDDSCNFIPEPPVETGLTYTGDNFPGLQLLSPYSLYRPGELPVNMELSPEFGQGRSKIVVEGTLPEMATDIFMLVIGDEELALNIQVGTAATGPGQLMVMPWVPQLQPVRMHNTFRLKDWNKGLVSIIFKLDDGEQKVRENEYDS